MYELNSEQTDYESMKQLSRKPIKVRRVKRFSLSKRNLTLKVSTIFAPIENHETIFTVLIPTTTKTLEILLGY